MTQFATSLARILMANPLLAALSLLVSVLGAWYAIISFTLSAQYLYAACTFIVMVFVFRLLNRYVLPVMKTIKAQRQ